MGPHCPLTPAPSRSAVKARTTAWNSSAELSCRPRPETSHSLERRQARLPTITALSSPTPRHRSTRPTATLTSTATSAGGDGIPPGRVRHAGPPDYRHGNSSHQWTQHGQRSRYQHQHERDDEFRHDQRHVGRRRTPWRPPGSSTRRPARLPSLRTTPLATTAERSR